MSNVNTYGLKMLNLKEASSNTGDYGYNSAMYDELFYNKATGEVWTVFQCSLGQNTWTEYHDSNIIKICNTDKHMTMQEIADAIRDRMERR